MATDAARRFRPIGDGFTLVEFLVVMAIIALLLVILLPALSMAQRTAHAAVCASNLRQMGLGMQFYAIESNGYLAGPETSGRWFNAVSNEGSNASSHWFRRGPIRAALTNLDWISPTVGEHLGTSAEDRFFLRLQRLYSSGLHCPANLETYDYLYPSFGSTFYGQPVTSIRYLSYAAVLSFHYNLIAPGPTTIADLAAERGLPSGYVPRIDNVGNAAGKVYAIEGTRFLFEGSLSFNDLPWQYQGGNFMVEGPHRPRDGDPFIYDAGGEPTEDSQRAAFRHPGRTLNAVFFDGHVERLDARAAQNPFLFLPRGTDLGPQGVVP